MFSKRYWLVLFIYIAVLLSGLIVAPIMHFFFSVDLFDAAIYWNVISFIIGLFVIVAMMWDDVKAEILNSSISVGQMFGWSILGLILAYAAQIIAITIEMNVLGINPSSENTDLIMDITRMAPIFIVIPAIIAPILEELVFRKIIFGTLYKKMNFFFAALISSIMFGLLHMDFVHLLVYAAIGFVFSFLYVKTKRIIVPIIVHMSINTITVTAQLLIDPAELEKMQNDLLMILIGG